MEITEVKLTRIEGDEKLKAFVSITFDDAFVVRDLKIINGTKGEFVAMPSRKLTEHCPKCGRKNCVNSKYCGTCGAKIPQRKSDEMQKMYADIAHPINSECRTMIQERVIEEYRKLISSDKKAESAVAEGDAGPLDDVAVGFEDDDEQQSKEGEENSKDTDTDDFSEGIW